MSSPAFEDGGKIPTQYTCHGIAVNPPLQVEDLPGETKSIAIIVEDPDAPNGTFDHWVTWNIEPTIVIPENLRSGDSGKNGKGQPGYTGPCPPSGTHRYFFRVYALNDKLLDLKGGASRQELEQAMRNHIVGSGELMGRYSKIIK